MKRPSDERRKALFDVEARLSWVLAALAGLLGAAAFIHTEGYFVTFMTGNTERAVLSYFRGQGMFGLAAFLIILSFLSGVVIASLCRRHFWSGHPHGPTMLTTFALISAAIFDATVDPDANDIDLLTILFVAFGIGSLNTSFTKNGEVSVPLSYVTGTWVKMGQGIERHISGGDYADWLGYFLLLVSFATGALAGGLLSTIETGWSMLTTAAAVCLIASVYTFLHERSNPPDAAEAAAA
ncbi:MAG: YoaK family protein [Segniliparus sp.]|uniref:YoaK family protein n=1 Tax=Segniliparus sp. TaxID=2804064 RepID=UPI003F405C17